ncbi:hypothetical protein DFH09DRAFT_1091513 [Mycena vulgaris]|nr:hypothetical protein DFH09DRAFT_1091513 [Mycena vulgaris]
MPANIHPLDENSWDVFQVGGEGLQFLSSQTGIYDADELKKHVQVVQAKAYQIRADEIVLLLNSIHVAQGGLQYSTRIFYAEITTECLETLQPRPLMGARVIPVASGVILNSSKEI